MVTRPGLCPQDPTFKPCQMKTHFLLPFPVNYVAECVRTAPYTDPDHARYRPGGRLLRVTTHTAVLSAGPMALGQRGAGGGGGGERLC